MIWAMGSTEVSKEIIGSLDKVKPRQICYATHELRLWLFN